MAVARVGTVCYIIFCFTAAIYAQYTDDSDYNDLDVYGDMPISYVGDFAKDHSSIVQDDFYILSEFEDADIQQDIYPNSDNLQSSFQSKEDALKRRDSFASQLHWYKPERVYRYTKHRIPGYDYEELDYVAARNFQQCDEKSVWTHCLCQFTCSEPDIVDCYTPCKSGCECKEEYVYDEKKEQCLLPEHCSSKEENFIYNK